MNQIIFLVIFALLLISIIVFVYLYLSNKWKCENNNCVKNIFGKYMSENECKNNCSQVKGINIPSQFLCRNDGVCVNVPMGTSGAYNYLEECQNNCQSNTVSNDIVYYPAYYPTRYPYYNYPYYWRKPYYRNNPRPPSPRPPPGGARPLGAMGGRGGRR